MRQILRLVLVVIRGLGSGASAGAFFVSVRGDDAAAGTSADTALATNTKGVTLLKPGDRSDWIVARSRSATDVRRSGTPLIASSFKHVRSSHGW